MRKFATCFFAFILCAPSAFGATVSRVIPAGDTGTDVTRATPAISARTTVSRTASRTIKTETDSEVAKQKEVVKGGTLNEE